MLADTEQVRDIGEGDVRVGHVAAGKVPAHAFRQLSVGRRVLSEPSLEGSGAAGATFFGDDASGEYGAVVLWASREAAEQAAEALFPQLQQALSGVASEPPRHPLYEVVRQVDRADRPRA